MEISLENLHVDIATCVRLDNCHVKRSPLPPLARLQ